MEPLFFKAENSLAHCGALAGKGGLQWSRFFSKRKIQPRGRRESRLRDASMEPLFFKAENMGRILYSPSMPGQLQWSRFFSKRKIPCSSRSSLSCARFNGAAFFQSGKSDVDARQGVDRAASMEPLFFKAENTAREPLAKPPSSPASMEPLFFKAENTNSQRQRLHFSLASMEPLFFKAENV